MKLYAVSSGFYSDYSVLALFEFRETAETWIEAEMEANRRRRIRSCEADLTRNAAIRQGELVGAFVYREDSKIREELERLRSAPLPPADREEYRVEEFTYYPGQELPAPGVVTAT